MRRRSPAFRCGSAPRLPAVRPTVPSPCPAVPRWWAATIRADPEEWPVREVELAAYRIARCAVTIHGFADFVDATGYSADAERYGWSFVFGGFLPDDFPPARGVAAAPWWREVPGADWAHPEGPRSSVVGVDGTGCPPVNGMPPTRAQATSASG
ncbi:SUMF1/EgtB/PvdO family nonheme iron enzyme [Nocardioides guangzhouensis]|uniref:SUMF1/EgtB/PvdO family nonheme iron enzyme n=1 Tax=Nocardioides guangzhouensis TaxID=2497878 RepID=UPI001FEA957A|nr:SUMF1/EgtB/PvdO family nonheme iron enzyme [Nocardioides guangzhouensis]